MAKAAGYLPHTGPIVTRAEAKAIGAKRYFTGKPCKRGHVSEYYTSIAQCVACSRAQTYEWMAANPERWDEARKQWIAANTQRINGQVAAWREAHPDRWRASLKEWTTKNKAKILKQRRARRIAKPNVYRAHAENRRARKLATGGSYTAQQIDNLFILQRHKCANCSVSIQGGFEIDHIVALSKGGSSDISNIQLLCKPCNRRKHTKSPEEWAREQGRLL